MIWIFLQYYLERVCCLPINSHVLTDGWDSPRISILTGQQLVTWCQALVDSLLWCFIGWSFLLGIHSSRWNANLRDKSWLLDNRFHSLFADFIQDENLIGFFLNFVVNYNILPPDFCYFILNPLSFLPWIHFRFYVSLPMNKLERSLECWNQILLFRNNFLFLVSYIINKDFLFSPVESGSAV